MVRTLEGMRLVRNRYHGGSQDGVAHAHSECELVACWGWIETLIAYGDKMAHDLWDDWDATGGPMTMRSEWEAVKGDILATAPGRPNDTRWPIFRGPILREEVDDIYGGVPPPGRVVIEPDGTQTPPALPPADPSLLGKL